MNNTELLTNEVKQILKDFETLKNNDTPKKELNLFYIRHKDTITKYLDSLEYKSINWHYYKWYNLLFMSMSNNPWTFWTYNQLKKEGYQVQKGAKSEQILVPIFEDPKTKDTIKFFKTCYIFNINQCEPVEK